MYEIFQWININQGVVMVLLTLSYVVITTLLLFANRKMRKQDLMLRFFERRMSIYTIMRKFLSKIITDAECTSIELQQYLRDTRDAKFLFKKDVVDYIDEIYKKGLRLSNVSSKLNASCDDREALLNDQEEVIDWFVEQIKQPKSVFDEYIDINKIHF